ncbi:hypothetical protein AJ79_01899 [Helicocarpus griseus UAMH5409]|uniref:Uncharacterized protein n=1 Tax=Helicocarpus griseus UAMH5409 TaxID=1447875 RepID=A0A2B7Y5H9_9EURO|nr:hypothetical protein AJ79_01899 [Helicocarpus griseus UAMH5409]
MGKPGQGVIGFCCAADLLFQHLDKNPLQHAESHMRALRLLRDEFEYTLGHTDYFYTTPGVPPSRFSNTNEVWEYSPFLCGVALGEALEIAHLLGEIPDAYTAIVEADDDVRQDTIKDATGARKLLPFSPRVLLGVLLYDILDEICSPVEPLSNFNYVAAAGYAMHTYSLVEAELEQLGNPTWKQASSCLDPNGVRSGLTLLALETKDEQLLQVFAKYISKIHPV